MKRTNREEKVIKRGIRDRLQADSLFDDLSYLKGNKIHDEYIFFEYDEQKSLYKCRLCPFTETFKERKNMKQLFSHVSNHKDDELLNCLVNLHNENIKKDKKQILDDLILKLIVNNNISLSFVESPELKQFVQIASKDSYDLPSRKTLTSMLVNENNEIYDKIKYILNEQKCKNYSVSLDIWSPTKKSFGYLGVSLFTLDDNFELKCFPIGCRKIYKEHSVENIWKLLELILERVGLKYENENIIFITDGGSNVRGACKTKRWMYCMAHQAERSLTVAQQQDPYMSSQLKIANDLYHYFRERDWKHYKEYAVIQETLKMNEGTETSETIEFDEEGQKRIDNSNVEKETDEEINIEESDSIDGDEEDLEQIDLENVDLNNPSENTKEQTEVKEDSVQRKIEVIESEMEKEFIKMDYSFIKASDTRWSSEVSVFEKLIKVKDILIKFNQQFPNKIQIPDFDYIENVLPLLNKVKKFVNSVSIKNKIMIHTAYSQLLSIQHYILKNVKKFYFSYDEYDFIDVKYKNKKLYLKKRAGYVEIKDDFFKGRSNVDKYFCRLLFQLFVRFRERDILIVTNFFNKHLWNTFGKHHPNVAKLTKEKLKSLGASERDISLFHMLIENGSLEELLHQQIDQLPTIIPIARKYLTIIPSEAESERMFSIAKEIFIPQRRNLTSKMLESLVIIEQVDKSQCFENCDNNNTQNDIDIELFENHYIKQ